MSKLPTPTMSATIGGVVSNRVKRVRRWRRRPAGEPDPRAPRFRADRAVVGAGTVQICVSAPEAFAAKLERAAAERRLSKSHLIRLAVERLLAEDAK